jgi:hypothetical protein
MTISFNTFAKVEKVANAGRQGSNLSSGKKGGGGGEGTTDSVAEDTGTDDTGIRDAADVEFDEAVGSASSPKTRFEALKAARGARALGTKSKEEVGLMDPRKLRKNLRITPDVGSDDIEKGITNLEFDDDGTKLKRGYTFAGKGLDALKIDEGLRNIDRKISDAQDSQDAQKSENDSVIEGKKDRLLKMEYLLRKSGSPIEKDPKTKMYSFRSGKQGLIPTLTDQEKRVIQQIKANEDKSLAGSGMVFDPNANESPSAVLVRLYNKLQGEIDKREKSVIAYRDRQKELGAARSRFKGQLTSLVKNMSPEEKEAYQKEVQKRDAAANKSASK